MSWGLAAVPPPFRRTVPRGRKEVAFVVVPTRLLGMVMEDVGWMARDCTPSMDQVPLVVVSEPLSTRIVPVLLKATGLLTVVVPDPADFLKMPALIKVAGLPVLDAREVSACASKV